MTDTSTTTEVTRTVKESLFSVAFWKFAAERAVSNLGEVAVAAVGIDAATNGFDILNFDWKHLISISLGAAIVSVFMSLRVYRTK